MGSKVAVIQAYVAIFADLNKIIDAALAIPDNGKVDILILNAATGDDCFLEGLTKEVYQAQMDVNLKGTPGTASMSHLTTDALLLRSASHKRRFLTSA